MATYSPPDLAFERGEGAYLYTADGTRYLDFISGIGVTALGHLHPHLLDAVDAQLHKLWHTANLVRIPGQERLAQRLVAHSFADKVFFANSGAEAVECALKTARKYHAVTGAPERYRIVAFEGAFHGRTLATIAAGGQADKMAGFGPPLAGFDHVSFGDLDAVRAAVGDETAAILVEPVQGESGIRPASDDFLRGLRALADDTGLLLIFDEVQCGMGRTGRLFAHEWSGVAPDIMALAKALGGGVPIGACLATTAAAQGMTVGTHGSTFGGNPLAMAAGNAVLDVMLESDFFDGVRRIAGHFQQKLAMLPERYPNIIESVRGVGLMLGLKCRIENAALYAALRDQHLLAARAGDNVVRFLPPLIITEAHIGEAVEAIEAACEVLQKEEAGS